MKQVCYLSALVLLLSSCGFSVTQPLADNHNPYHGSSFEPLQREDYSLLTNTTGTATARQVSLLFFPIGKSKTNRELESNAYNDAVANCKYADAVIMPRAEYKRFSIPLILINYSSRKITVSGRGVKIKEKSGDLTGTN